MSQIKIYQGDKELTVHIKSVNCRYVDMSVRNDLSIDMQVPVGMSWEMIERYVRLNEEKIFSEYERKKAKNHQMLPITLELENGKVRYHSGLKLPFLGDTNMKLRIKYRPDYNGTNVYVKKEEDGHGAIYIEAANLKDMCDFNEVLHGASTSDGTMFSQLSMFLDKSFFDEHPYVYVYMDGNALIYYVFAAYTRDDTRLLEEYDFTYASGCQAFLDEIYGGRSMDKLIRQGWEDQVQPENFLITLTTLDALSGRQLIVVGCLVGDVTGQINREMDYGAPEY